MLAIRLKRIGKKHQASFRLVVGERRSKLKGDYTEDVGWYSPVSKKGEFNAERIKYWMSVGAQASPTVNNLLLKHSVITGKKIAKHKQAKKVEGEKKAETSAAAAPAAETAAAPAEAPKA